MPLERMPEMFLDEAPVGPHERAQIAELALRMEDIAYAAGLRRFDRVRIVTAEHELWFIWDDEKLVIIVELGGGPEAVAEAFARAMAAGGDPVLN